MFHNLVYTYFCLLGYVEYRLVIWRAEYINVCSDAPIIKAYRGVETKYRAFLTLNLGRGELSAPQPDRFNPKKEPQNNYGQSEKEKHPCPWQQMELGRLVQTNFTAWIIIQFN